MLTYLRASLFKSGAQTLVNPVNCVGVMGKGLAAEFRHRYPQMFEKYRELCENQLLNVGQLWLWKGPNQWVLNFPTKIHWRSPSKIEFIELGLEKFVSAFQQRGITEVAFPRLGCGNGGLEWDEVKPLMERYLRPLPIPVYIHDYEVQIGRPEHIEIADLLGGATFPDFWADLSRVVAGNRSFQTFKSGSLFHAQVDEESLNISRGDGKRVRFSKDEIFEVWSALARGVTTRNKLTGRAFDEAYYIFSILAALPYVEPMQAERVGSAPAMGLKFVRRTEDGAVGITSSP